LKKGSKLVTFLNEGCDGEAIEAKYTRVLKELENVRVASARCRQDRVDQLREGLLEVEQLRRMYVDSARLEAEEYEGSLRELRRELDREILRVVLRHFATVEKELSIHLRRTSADTGDCVRLKRQLKASLHLSMFALHLENETSAQVVLRKLPATHPQSTRCRRAAAENIKPNFFGGAECLFSGIDVLDVYKVENRVLLQRFQQSASTMEPGKVKGLFCSVPASTVERIVSFGMFDDSDATEAAAVHQAVFKRTWFAHRSGGGGFAEKRIAKADVVRFPLTFSRYSTLEVDRPSLSCGMDDAGPAPGGRAGGRGGGAAQTVPSGAPPVPMPPGGKPSESGGADESADGDTDADDGSHGGIRYLVLCRVVVGKVFVTSKEYTGFPTVGANLAFDSMFNPAQVCCHLCLVSCVLCLVSSCVFLCLLSRVLCLLYRVLCLLVSSCVLCLVSCVFLCLLSRVLCLVSRVLCLVSCVLCLCLCLCLRSGQLTHFSYLNLLANICLSSVPRPLPSPRFSGRIPYHPSP
jgi:hypothetical protein